MKSFPFDSLALYQDEKTGLWIGDRQGSAQDVRDINKIFWKNGVCLALENAFQITPGEGMNVIVAPGVCGIEGTLGIEPNERGLSLQASSSEDRIDTIVLRLNLNVEVRKIDLYVKTGVAQSVPVRPELTRSESVWELGIADIFVAKNSGAVSAARITDTRLQNERCGMMTPLMEVDTTSFYNQLQAAIDEKIAEIDALANFTYLKGGFYAVHTEDDGHLYAYYDDEENPPPLSLNGGRLYYTVNEDNVLDLGRVNAMPAGSMMQYAGQEAPDGWLMCDGSVVSREEYSALFDAIGTTYGTGDGSTTFALPDMRGRFALGSSTSHVEGQTGGSETVTLTVNEIPSHAHQQYVSANQGNSAVRMDYQQDGNFSVYPQCLTGYVGGGKAHNNMPPFLSVNYIISTGV